MKTGKEVIQAGHEVRTLKWRHLRGTGIKVVAEIGFASHIAQGKREKE